MFLGPRPPTRPLDPMLVSTPPWLAKPWILTCLRTYVGSMLNQYNRNGRCTQKIRIRFIAQTVEHRDSDQNGSRVVSIYTLASKQSYFSNFEFKIRLSRLGFSFQKQKQIPVFELKNYRLSVRSHKHYTN